MLRKPNSDGFINYLRWARPAKAILGWLRRARIERASPVASQRIRWSILGCLLQPWRLLRFGQDLWPGLLLDQALRSMGANSLQLIKFCCTRPDSYRDVPAAETKSIGLPADARVVMHLPWHAEHRQGFLHATLTTLSWRDKSCPFMGTMPSGQFHRDPKRPSIYRSR